MRDSAADVYVLGGGISGLTTAIVLQSLGLKVQILAAQLPNALSPQAPAIATSYAMASAYPHNLNVADLKRISRESQTIFSVLSEDPRSAVELHQIFEVFETEPAPPHLGSERIDMQMFDGEPTSLKQTIAPPSRSEAQYLWGWNFKSYFADLPRYLSFLWTRFKDQGGKLRLQNISAADIAQVSNKLFVNCLGMGAIEFCSDKAPSNVVRGKQVIIPGAPRLRNTQGLVVAYNYTPAIDVFPRGDGNPEYVHFFSREDGWLLGQTREPGSLDIDGGWHGTSSPVPSVELNGIQVPHQIIDLNRQLLRNWLNIGLPEVNMVAREGYRYYRDAAGEGVRLETETKNNNFVVHNYGHGGSGVTMSWGCALQAARLLTQQITPKNKSYKDRFERTIQSSLASAV